MTKAIRAWEKDRFEKLKKRLDHHRRLGQSLLSFPTLAHMNDRAMLELESKLSRLRTQRSGAIGCLIAS